MVLIFDAEAVKSLHEEVIKIRGLGGIISAGMLETCLERPFLEPYGHKAFPTIFLKAAALLHSIIVFHPFIDGNKRTALLATTLFLALNGYSLMYPRDTVQFTLSIAKLEIDDVEKIAQWMERSCEENELYGMDEDVVISKSEDFLLNFPGGTTTKLQVAKR